MGKKVICMILAIMLLFTSVEIPVSAESQNQTIAAEVESETVLESETETEEAESEGMVESESAAEGESGTESEAPAENASEGESAGGTENGSEEEGMDGTETGSEEENASETETASEEESVTETESLTEETETEEETEAEEETESESIEGKEYLEAAVSENTLANTSSVTDSLTSDGLIKVGDYIILGKYNGQPILWRCVDIDENGPLMFSDKILCLKPFDAAGTSLISSHSRGNSSTHKRQSRGSCYWADSNIRDWLNSTAEAGKVRYSDEVPPTNGAVYRGLDDYADESGFLSDDNFSVEELALIKTVTQKFVLNKVDVDFADGGTEGHSEGLSISNFLLNYDTAYYKNTTDRMFLLNLKQLQKVYNRFGDYYKGYITAEGAAQSERSVSAGEHRNYWLRDSMWNDYVSTHARIVGGNTSGRELDFFWAYDDKGTGVRPAFYLNTEIAAVKQGDGSEENPFYLEKSDDDKKINLASDEAIIAEVKKYTSDEFYAQWNAIMNSNLSHDEKFKRLNELSHNNGITDIKEGIQYFSEVSSHRRDYIYLTTNENYCSFDWYYWLNTTMKGNIARGLLYADGLIFNFELASYIDWTTYANGSYPGVEKCKTMLKEFMDVGKNETLASEVAGESKKMVKNIKNAIKINNLIADAEAEEIMTNVSKAQTKEQLEKFQKQFADWLIRQARVQQKIEVGGEVKMYLGAESMSKVLGYVAPIINFAAATTDDVVEMMFLENDIRKYEEYNDFLETIYSSQDISMEMRIAAYQLHDDIENGYKKRIQSILTNFITFETSMIYVDKSLLNTYLESKGISTTIANPLGEALGTITLAAVISNIVIDTGDFVKQAAYTMSYAELSTLYSLKLQADREAFKANPSAENAWQFYEDYNLLWKLRYKGEEQYLKMNTIKMFIFTRIKTYRYDYKEEVVKDVLNCLEQCRFELADNVTVPESVQYIKKVVIECPVDVLVYTKEGMLVAELRDGVISDTTNEYGRFAVVYESYSQEYAKVICQSSDVDLDVKIISIASGLVDYKSAQSESDVVLVFDKVAVEEGDIIKVSNNQYQIIHKNNEEDAPEQLFALSGDYLKPESILLKEASIDLLVGEARIIKISVLPGDTTNKSVSWYSEDEEIASVKNGVVVGKTIGETIIWVKACDNEAIEEKIKVRVVEGKENSSNDILPSDIPSDGIIPDGIWVAGIADKTYTGSSAKQSFRVYDGTKRLKEKTDYTVTYKNNKNAYTYTEEDYTAFEENLKETGKRTKTGAFDPKKAPQVTIKMKGNYSGSQTIYFRINQADITGEDFEVQELTVTYTGKKQTPAPKLTWNGKTLKYGTDFYVTEYDSSAKDKTAFRESKTYDLTIVGKKNFTGTIPFTLTISDSVKQIAMNKVTIKGIKDQPWTGEQVKQTGFLVSYQKDKLTEVNGDYTLSWGVNTDVGVGTVTFTGTGIDADGDGYSYIGTRKVTFKITGTSMNKVAIAGIDKNYTYTGTAIEPEATLTYKAGKNTEPVPLVKGTHYTVTYQKNLEKGTAAIIFTGLASGGYTGSKKQTFNIVSSGIADKKEGESLIEQIRVTFKDTENVQDGIYTAPYMKGGAKPEITVSYGENLLEASKDYTVSYANNKKVALFTDAKAPSVIIQGKGNYSGKKTVYFSIAAKALSNENGITVVAKDKVESTKKNGYKQSFKVYDADGKILENSDYDAKNVTYTLIRTEDENGTAIDVNEKLDKNSVISANSVIQITIQGKGIYAGGTATGTYRILENSHDISKATIQINNQNYTGNPVMITQQSQFKTGKVYIKIGKEKKELILGEDIEVVPGSYVKNVSKGTAKVTFRGINDFGGTKTVSFTIGARSIGDFWKGIYTKVAELFS